MKYCILWLALATFASASPTPEFFRLAEGVGGGYAPKPISFELLVLSRPSQGGYDIYYKKLDSGGYKAWHKTMADLGPLQADLEGLGLFRLPQAAPNELDDIYQSETALQVRTDQHRWSHSPPTGCVRGRAKVQPTALQRQTFLKAAARLHQLAQGGEPCALEEMQKAEISSRQ